jgi:hypothetical protein
MRVPRFWPRYMTSVRARLVGGTRRASAGDGEDALHGSRDGEAQVLS